MCPTSHSPRNSNESDAHRMMQRVRIVTKWLLVIASVATVVLFVVFREAAYLAAIPVPLLVLVYAVVSQLEKESRKSAARKLMESERETEDVELDIQVAGLFTGLGVFFLLALGTFIVAASFFDWHLVGIAATAFLLLAMLIEIPYLPLFIQEAEKDEKEKLKHGK